MRIHRIELRNYRGVTSAAVELAEHGVSIIEGDNEVGKTSLVEGLDLLLTTPDSSQSAKVRSLQPTGQDVGPEVRVELSTGPYRLTYAKRWLRRPQTTLTVTAPRRQQLSGREAHDRMDQILAETLDVALWDALRLQQGAELAQVGYGTTSLSRALDRAAGGDRAGDREDALWDRIVAERERYWTATGKPRAERQALAARLAEAETRLAALEADVRTLDRQAEELTHLEGEAAALDRELGRHRAALDAVQQEAEVVAGLRQELARCVALHQAAVAGLESEHTAARHRRALADRVAAATTALAEASERAAELAPSRLAAETGHAEAVAAHQAAQEVARTAEAAERQAAADSDHRRREIEVVQLTERRDRVAELQAVHHAASVVLERNRVDARILQRLEAAHLEHARAEAAAAADAPTIVAEGLGLFPATLVVDGTATDVAAGTTEELELRSSLELEVPGVVRLTVRAGAEAQARTDRVAAAAAELAVRCEQAGVADLDEARRAATARQDAERAVAQAARSIAQDLRDLTPDDLRHKVDRLTARLATDAAQRSAELPLPEDLDAAQAAAEAAGRAARVARDAAAATAEALATAAEARSEAKVDDAGRAARVAQLRDALDRDGAALAEARAERSDEDQQTALVAATSAAQATAEARRSASEHLERAQPDALAQRHAATRAEVERTTASLRRTRDRSQQLRGILDDRGEQGLAHHVDQATAIRDQLARDHTALEARAEAALLLHRTFARHRTTSRQAYLAPFRDRLEEFGRLVFGPTFEVELAPDLSIATRTLQGTTVDHDQLSTGAREQLGLLSRLACASLVAADGGAPVVFDDALGWTDPTRLTQMGTAIELAGRDCQVIVLTCTPDRYAAVGRAKVIRLPTDAIELRSVI